MKLLNVKWPTMSLSVFALCFWLNTNAQELEVSIDITYESSEGANDGSLTATATGGTPPYSYLWSNGSTYHTISDLGADSYTLYLTDHAETFVTTVISLEVSIAPEFTSSPVITVDEGTSYSYLINTNDENGDEVTVTATEKPDWLTLSSYTGEVSTFAGSSTSGNANGTGTAASFNSPSSIALDESGNLFIADKNNHLIRKITPAGVVSTYAGTGSSGSADGTLTSAQFDNPNGIAIANSGNIYITDINNYCIRKITPEGVVSTLAGSTYGYADGTGSAAKFKSFAGISVDKHENIYISDVQDHRIRKITKDGVVSTIAGSGVAGNSDGTGTDAQFNYPYEITVDANDNLFLVEGGHRIRKITPEGVVTTIAGSTSGFADGTGTAAQFYFPYGIAVDAFGTLFVADLDNKRIRKITPNGVVTTLAGSGSSGQADGTGTLAEFSSPKKIAIDALGNMYVLDKNSVRKILNHTALIGTPSSAEVGTHDVTLKADDGKGKTTEQSFTITVKDATAPSFSSESTATFAENGTGTAYTAVATDANTITYSLGSDNDEALFDIESTSGVVTFKSAPDFEDPKDGDANNTYIINVIASDIAKNTANQEVAITVTDVDETVLGLSTGSINSLSIYPNPVTEENFTISFEKVFSGAVSVLDLEGRLIQTIDVVGKNVALNLSGEVPGIYLLKLTSPEGTAQTKLIKQ